jgi:hypothetical protein
MFSAAKLLEMLARSPYDLAELDLRLPRRFQQELLVPCPWGRKAAVLRQVHWSIPHGSACCSMESSSCSKTAPPWCSSPSSRPRTWCSSADADSEELARQHAQRFAELIQQWQQ